MGTRSYDLSDLDLDYYPSVRQESFDIGLSGDVSIFNEVTCVKLEKFNASFTARGKNVFSYTLNYKYPDKTKRKTSFEVVGEVFSFCKLVPLNIIAGSHFNARGFANDLAVEVLMSGRNFEDNVVINLWGDKDIIDKLIVTNFNNNDKDVNKNWVYWYYTDVRGRLNSNSFELNNDTSADNLFYPYFNKPIDQIYDEYDNSSASVLLLMGEPGTGKTTFLKNYIREKNKNTMFTFDENVMNTDEFFISFMASPNINLLVIEDADVLLTSRETDGNKIMSKFLNVSDGLIKLKGKKIIFTTNTQKVSSIDEALIRPGRCYDVLKFDKLTYEQTLPISSKFNISEMTNKDNKYTLSEVFNKNTGGVKPKVGF